jgi:hypothetical protein
VVQRKIAFFGGLVDQAGMALAEGAAGRILPRQAHRIALGQQRAEGERLGGGPVDAGSRVDHRALGLQQAGHGAMGDEPVGQAGQRGADLAEQRLGNRRPAALVLLRNCGARSDQRPSSQSALLGLKAAAGLELVVQMRLERGLHVLDLALGDQPSATSLSV